MVSETDEKEGLVKTYWHLIRKRVAKVEPVFAKIIDELDPDESFPLYLAYYPYGAIKGDTQSTLFPSASGEYFRISDTNAPTDLVKNLGYSKNSAPFALLLEKNLELFVDLPAEKVTIPRIIYQPGSFFPLARILSRTSSRTYAPNSILTLTSGARSVFMLPNIGCATNHVNLQRDFNVHSSPPKSLYEHWFVFKDIANASTSNSDWRSCLLYFSFKWLDKLENDKSWLPLKLYLHEIAWKHYEYQRNNFYYDVFFSMAQKRRNLKPNPYLADTARHLFTIALGSSPGYSLSIDEESMPTKQIVQAFTESYGLKKYIAHILSPKHFDFDQDNSPVYYSLQHPSTHMFSPKSRTISSTLTEMRELAHITNIFSQELSKENGTCNDTVLADAAKIVDFQYYHNKPDRHRIIQPSTKIPDIDKRFAISSGVKPIFSADAPFVRGCVSIKVKT